MGLLNPSLTCGNPSRNISWPTAEMGGQVSRTAVSKCVDRDCSSSVSPRQTLKRSAEALGKASERIFQNLRARSMTNDKGAQAAIPHQDKRNLSCRAWFSLPRDVFYRYSRRDFGELRRLSHGIARAIESMRRVRLSLVSCPDPRERLLPRL